MVSLRGDVVDMGILIVSDNLISQQSRYELPQVAYVYWRYIYDVIELWSGQRTLKIISPIIAAFSKYINWILNWIHHFRLFYREAADEMIQFDASFTIIDDLMIETRLVDYAQMSMIAIMDDWWSIRWLAAV